MKNIKEVYAAFEALDSAQKENFLTLIRGRLSPSESERPEEPNRPHYSHALYQIESILMLESDIQNAARMVLETIRNELGYDHLALGLLKRDQTLRFLAHMGYEEGKVPAKLFPKEGITGLAVIKGHLVNIADVTQIPQYVKALNGIRSEIAVPIFGEQGRILGVLNAESRRPNAFSTEDERALTSVANQLSVAIRSAKYLEERDKYYGDLQAAYRGTLYLLVDFLEKRFPYLIGHSHHVAVLAAKLGRRFAMDEREINLLYIAGELHDIGKIHLPQTLLLKAEAFDDDEWQVMREHARIGCIIASKVPIFKDHIARWILHHHERYDGKGYPDRLRGEEIPLGARLIAVADAWDAMISARPYKEAFSMERSLQELRECAGKQFDPLVVETFLGCFESREIHER